MFSSVHGKSPRNQRENAGCFCTGTEQYLDGLISRPVAELLAAKDLPCERACKLRWMFNNRDQSCLALSHEA